MVFQREEETACGEAEDVVSGDVAVLPWHGLDGAQDGVALLSRRDDDATRSSTLCESLRFGLDYFCR